MFWLFGQTWLWILIAFILGLAIGFLIAWLLRKKEVDVTEERISGPAAKTSAAEGVDTGGKADTSASVEADSSGAGLGLAGAAAGGAADVDPDMKTPAVGMPALSADLPSADTDGHVDAATSEADSSAETSEAGTSTPAMSMISDDRSGIEAVDLSEVEAETDTTAVGADAAEAETSGDDAETASSTDTAASVSAIGGGAAQGSVSLDADTGKIPAQTDATESLATSTQASDAALPTQEAAPSEAAEPAASARTVTAGPGPVTDTHTDTAASRSAVGVRERVSTSATGAGAEAPALEPVSAGAATPHGPNSAKPLADGAAPSAEFTVKGNEGSMLYHTTDSPYYKRTKAEVWFKTTADAETAGFKAWNRRRR